MTDEWVQFDVVTHSHLVHGDKIDIKFSDGYVKSVVIESVIQLGGNRVLGFNTVIAGHLCWIKLEAVRINLKSLVRSKEDDARSYADTIIKSLDIPSFSDTKKLSELLTASRRAGYTGSIDHGMHDILLRIVQAAEQLKLARDHWEEITNLDSPPESA